jgi:CRP-like cAMP-binding protein
VDLTELLSRSALFSSLDGAVLHEVAGAAVPCSYSRNELVFSEGDEASQLYVVCSGRVAIGTRSLDGRSSLVALMEPGDLFGEMGLFDGEPRSADARALEASDLVAIPYPAVRRPLEERPEQLWEVVALLARRLRATDAALSDAVFLDVPGRTAKRLLEIAGGDDEFVLPVTQEELAGIIGASRERVNKAISAFIRLGWLEQQGRRYRILDRTQLDIRSR